MSSLTSDLESPAEASSTGSIRAFRESAPEVAGGGGKGRVIALVALVLAVAGGAAWFVINQTGAERTAVDAGAVTRAADAGAAVSAGIDAAGLVGAAEVGPGDAGADEAGAPDASAPAADAQVLRPGPAVRPPAGPASKRTAAVASGANGARGASGEEPARPRRPETGAGGAGGEPLKAAATNTRSAAGGTGGGAGGEGDAPPARPSGLAALDQGKGQVAVADPRALRPELLPDTLEQAQISAVLAQSRSGVRACFERQLKRDPTMDRARVTLGFEVRGDGTAHNVKLDREIDGTVLEGCLTAMVRRWRFPRFSGAPIPVSTPLLFQRSM